MGATHALHPRLLHGVYTVAGRGDDPALPRLRTFPVRLEGDDVVVTPA